MKVDNWVVAVACDLDAQFVKRKPDGKETPTEKKQREFIEKEFDVPGDYRIERLYAKLSCEFNSKYLAYLIILLIWRLFALW
jgi:hypothetical protein